MYKNCPNCGLLFEIEPGFFIGAMYVSYAFSILILLLVGLLMYLFIGDPPIWAYAVCAILPIVTLHPVIFRYSRVLYLHIFGGIRYTPNGDK